MNRIGILPPDVASKIAAGEVITRPASVIKELVENALDAGAYTVSVEFAEGGCRQIRVTDDGCGMWPEEAPLSLLRHATSKLQDDSDLLCLKTMGFRGEALPSIAAVSRLEICTRSPELDLGCRLFVDGGILQENLPWAGPAGTQVTVTDLFYNTPARRKFLRSHAAEQGQILELMRHLALGYPEIHFLVQAQGKTLLQTPAHAGLRERLAAILGPESAEKMLPLDLPGHGLRVTGLVSSPDHNLATSKYQFLLVNRRIVSDKLLAGAMRQGYQGLLPRGRHPMFIMHLEAAPEQVDINVHPAKAEVRFKDSGRVYAHVLQAVRQALEPAQLPGRQEFAAQWQAVPANSASPGPVPVHQVQEPLAELFSSLPPLPAGITPLGPRPAPAPETRPHETAWRFGELDVLGQLQSSYILAQAPEGLLIIDQHAAHERVLFELLTNTPEHSAPRQTLLFPLPVELDPVAAAWVEKHLPELEAAGLELEPFGGTTYLVRCVPACLADQDLASLVPEMAAELAPWQHGQDSDQVRRRLHLTMACRGAIKAGQRLNPEEMHHLLVQLDSLAVSSHCPHGRPLWRLLSMPEIRQNFRRPRH
jgi:DNA mismatch repair protein MutL